MQTWKDKLGYRIGNLNGIGCEVVQDFEDSRMLILHTCYYLHQVEIFPPRKRIWI